MQQTDRKTNSLFKREIRITLTKFLIASLIYLVLPVLIFFVGYLKPIWAILFSAVTIACSILLIRNAKVTDQVPLASDERSVTVKISCFLFLIPFVLILVFLGGIGEFSWCLADHNVRYAVLNDLVEYKWPIIYDFSTQHNPAVAEALGDGRAAFAYYFIFWMVPALIGKAFGILAARIAICLWSALGLILIALGAMLLYGKQSKFLFVALMLFAGFDIFPYLYQQFSGFGSTWEDWTLHFRVVGNFYQIMNVFNQSIPGWLITVLLLLCANSRNLGFMGSLMFCYSPWAAIGLLPMCIVKLFADNRGLDRKKVIRNIITVGNLAAPVIFFVCFAPLYLANSNARYDSGLIWKFYDNKTNMIIDYIAYCVFEFGIWALIIFKKYKKEPMFYAAIATLMILPVYKMTGTNDLLMRGSMAPLFTIALFAVMYVTDHFNEMCEKDNRRVKPRLVVLAFFVAAYTSINFIITSTLFTSMIYLNMEPKQNMSTSIGSFGDIHEEEFVNLVKIQFYVYDYEDSPFFKYLAK